MGAETGVKLTAVAAGSPAAAAGLEAGDRLLRANGRPVRDVIDYLYESGEEHWSLEFRRTRDDAPVALRLEGGRSVGIELELPRTKTCRNKCIFCFVSQLPRGLRHSLYVKDEDYRFSFLFGNYMTLSNLTEADRRRILEQRLSPLYVSVHAVDPVKRRILLGPNAVTDILGDLRRLIRGGIEIHAQIVMCPGLNDGVELRRTIRALARLYPGVASLAVVPVGLTRFHRNNLVPVDRALARRTLDDVAPMMARYTERFGTPFVVPSDEFYLTARRELPPAGVYGDYPQIENGVGLLRDFLDRLDALALPRRLARKRRVLTFTGRSFGPYLASAARGFEAAIKGLAVDCRVIRNRFFGETVTVAGLLTGRDVVEQLRGASADVLLVPDVVLRDGDDVFLDDMPVGRLGKELRMPVRTVPSTPEGFLEGIRASARRVTGE